MSHASCVRQLIGAMKMYPFYSRIALLGILAIPPASSAGENAPFIEALRSKTIFLENYQLGSSKIDGELLQPDRLAPVTISGAIARSL